MKNQHPKFACLDGVRGLACVLVISTHIAFCIYVFGGILSGQYRMVGEHIIPPVHFPWSVTMLLVIAGGAKLGPLMFFSLSGFLMSYHYLPGNNSRRYWYGFLLRRSFRIIPALLLLLVITLTIRWLLHYFTPLFATFSNAKLILLLPSVVLTPLWTVPVEIQFYLLLPLLALAMLRFRVAPIAQIMLLALIATLGCLIYPHNIAQSVNLIYHLTFFLGGVMGAMLYKEYDLHSLLPQYAWNLITLGAFCLLCFCAPHYVEWPGSSIAFRSHYAWFFSPLVSLIILGAAVCERGLVRWLLANRFMRFLGTISYSLYLIHPLVFIVCLAYVPLAPWLYPIACVFLSVFIALLMYVLWEAPANAYGKKLTQKLWPTAA